MPHGELFFRKKEANATWVDMYDTYGISLSDASLSRLMTPAPNKEAVENTSRRQHGKRVVRDSLYVKKDARDVLLEMHITARPTTDGVISYTARQNFWRQYQAFCSDFLDLGFFDIASAYIKDSVGGAQVTVGGTSYGKLSVFRMTYVSCEEFSEFMQELAKFSITLNEPDPTNRGSNDTWNNET